MKNSESTRSFFFKRLMKYSSSRKSTKYCLRRFMRSLNLRKKIPDYQPEDRLSSLPDNAIEAILLCLPLKDAARTSILSRDWRYKWNHLPQLVFDRNFRLSDHQPLSLYGWKLANIVNQVLMRHQGPIFKFELSTGIVSSMDVDGWICFVSRNGIRELVLDNWLDAEMYKTPSYLFSCKEIIYLELAGSIEISEASFSGPINIRTLVLKYVHISDNGLEKFLSNCPFLNALELRDLVGCSHLKLYAPNLVDFIVDSELLDITFENTPLLAKASIRVGWESLQFANVATCKLTSILGCLPGIRRLELLDHTYPILSEGNAPVRLPNACQLSCLSTGMDFEHVEELLVALCIFRSCPVLRQVDIQSVWDKCDKEISIDLNYRDKSAMDFWEAQEDFDGLFSQLRIVAVKEFVGTKEEVKFVEIILANAPNLGVLHIKMERRKQISNPSSILTKLLQFKRLSEEAVILFQNGYQCDVYY